MVSVAQHGLLSVQQGKTGRFIIVFTSAGQTLFLYQTTWCDAEKRKHHAGLLICCFLLTLVFIGSDN